MFTDLNGAFNSRMCSAVYSPRLSPAGKIEGYVNANSSFLSKYN